MVPNLSCHLEKLGRYPDIAAIVEKWELQPWVGRQPLGAPLLDYTIESLKIIDCHMLYLN